jgi:GT2 family glycosyltransferase
VKLPDLSAPPGALVDIIVRAKNGHELTRACLDSIAANTPRDLYRLVLVDDGSEPAQDGQGADFVIRSAQSRGAVTATNLGLSLALTRTDAEYVLILDNDTQIPAGDTGWLGRMLAELEQGGPKTACVGATTGMANPPQHILRSPQTYAADWKDDRTGREGIKHNPPVPLFVSFAVLFHKRVLRQVGFWDERYNPGNWEDTDYAVACRLAGYEIRVARSVYIHHMGHQTFREELRTLLQVNGRKFHEKWGIGQLFDLGLVDRKQLKAAL